MQHKLPNMATAPSIKEMQATIPQTGSLTWIGLRPGKRMPLQVVDSVTVVPGLGLEGDHYSKQDGNRQVTLIQGEHLDGVATILGKGTINPGDVRRNLVVRGINLQAFKDRQFKIGTEVILEMTGDCHPCSRMEENLGAGGYMAMRGHGGITAKVIQGGTIHAGDSIELIPA